MAASTMIDKVPFTHVELTEGLWLELMTTNRKVGVPFQYEQCLKTGRIDAFKLKEREGCGDIHIFWDSDVAKWIEAAAYSLAFQPDPELEEKVDGVIRDMEAAQAPDGYLNTHYLKYGLEDRWSNLRDNHELYGAGHLMEGAAAYFQATGKRAFLEVMTRYADHIDTVFGPAEGQLKGYPGHEEIELGLVKLYEVTDEKRYLDLAAFFINERGQQGNGKPHYFEYEAGLRGGTKKHNHEYTQSHLPVREQTEIVGHAVRALYLYSGMADVAAHTGDTDLLSACKVIWKNLVTRRMAITGGVGPRCQNEGMSSDYDLPTEGAYLETCAAIALVFWAHRLFLATGDGEYLDVMERSLFNGTISGVDQMGSGFFYGNPLAAYPGFNGNNAFEHDGYHYRRQPWFFCSCCPTNMGRFLAQVPGYLYAVKGDVLYATIYADSKASVSVGEHDVQLIQTTHYPWAGDIRIEVQPEHVATWSLALRVPGWCREATITVNGSNLEQNPTNGFVVIKREWQPGDVVALSLAMPVEQIAANPQARQVSGRVALQRGPVVYCLEEADNGPALSNVFISRQTEFQVEKGPVELGGIPVLTAIAEAEETAPWKEMLYTPEETPRVPRPIRAIPYFLWANRDPGEMIVFLGRG